MLLSTVERDNSLGCLPDLSRASGVLVKLQSRPHCAFVLVDMSQDACDHNMLRPDASSQRGFRHVGQ